MAYSSFSYEILAIPVIREIKLRKSVIPHNIFANFVVKNNGYLNEPINVKTLSITINTITISVNAVLKIFLNQFYK